MSLSRASLYEEEEEDDDEGCGIAVPVSLSLGYLVTSSCIERIGVADQSKEPGVLNVEAGSERLICGEGTKSSGLRSCAELRYGRGSEVAKGRTGLGVDIDETAGVGYATGSDVEVEEEDCRCCCCCCCCCCGVGVGRPLGLLTRMVTAADFEFEGSLKCCCGT